MSYFPFFYPLSHKHPPPWVLHQSCQHKVPLHNLSLKAIIIRSLRLSHRGNMRHAFIRQMERGCSGLQWALGYEGGVRLVEWSIEMAWIWVKIMSYGWRVKMRTQGATPEAHGEDGHAKEGNQDEYNPRTKTHQLISPPHIFSIMTFSECAVVKNACAVLSGVSWVDKWQWWEPWSLYKIAIKYHSTCQHYLPCLSVNS